MKNRKKTLFLDTRKGGYLLIGRNQLKALFAEDLDLRQLAHVLLCVQTYAYFCEGKVWVKDRVYTCQAGEWITDFSTISRYTGVDRRGVKFRLQQLEQYGILRLEEMTGCKRIILRSFTDRTNEKQTHSGSQADADVINAPDLIAGAVAYYSNQMQEGGVN